MEKGTVYCVEFAIADGKAFDNITELLFSVSDTVCLHSEPSELDDKTGGFADLSGVVNEAVKSEELSIKGKKTLRLYFNPTDSLKDYFLSLRTFCANLKDSSLTYAPYIYFTDTLFLKDGNPVVTFNLRNNTIDTDPEVAEKVAAIYSDCMYDDPRYIKIKENFIAMPESRKRYFINTGIRLIKNLYIYLEREKIASRNTRDDEKLKAISAFLPKREWLNAAAYKSLINELFPNEFTDELAFAEDFLDVFKLQIRIERLMRKLEFYLVNEAGTPPKERSYVS